MNDLSSRRNGLLRLAAAALLVLLVHGSTATADPVLFVVDAARDTSAGFVSVPLPALGRRALVWGDGVITVPDSVPWLEHGRGSLAVSLSEPPLTGIAAGGVFRREVGQYDLDTPLHLDDGRVTAYLAAGRLDVTEGMVTYRRPATGRSMRGDFILLAGLILATGLLLHAARRRSRRS